MICATIKIKPSHSSQGDFVEINAEDFDEAKGHERYDAPPPPPPGPALPPPPPLPPAGPLDNLPANWRDKSPKELRDIAFAVSGRAVENKVQALEVIEAAIAAK
jgi:hypothetical protein